MTAELGQDIKPPKQKREDADLDITPMIDITFLLLAFFVVVSKMDPQTAVDLPKADYGDTVPEKNCVVFVVTVGDDPKMANIYKGRAKDDAALVQGEEEIDKEGEIADYVENQLSARPQVTAILIKAEGDVRTGAVETVRRGISGSDLAETRQIFVAVEEQ